jgi:cellulose biosynthesis protein BcsQ
MKTLAVFNNKGGVGKTTLTYHTACAFAELGRKTLLIDLDPQSNLTLFGLTVEGLHKVWEKEEVFIDDFGRSRKEISKAKFQNILSANRSIHFLLKPSEDGTAELPELAQPVPLLPNLDLIPGRLTIHMFENKIASRWSDIYSGDPLAIRTVSEIRRICEAYANTKGYEFILIDTSPSLGILNKVIISTADAFMIPCMPDMFSLYGIKNIGKALDIWKKDFDTIQYLLSDEKRKYLPNNFVQFIGYTIFNAKKYSGTKNRWNLAQAHYNYADQIPKTIMELISPELRSSLSDDILTQPIGEMAVMHSHSTLPNMAQKYRQPIWGVPAYDQLASEDKTTISGNRSKYEATKPAYLEFAADLLKRLEGLVHDR